MILSGIAGLCIGVVGFRGYTNITRAAEKVSILQIIKIAVQMGIASSLIFFATISSIGLFDLGYIWRRYCCVLDSWGYSNSRRTVSNIYNSNI
jgi:hypothetical protein